MSNTIDALIITEYAQQFADTVQVPSDINHGLWELRAGKINDERAQEELHASELFMNLGRIAYSLGDHRRPEYISGDNPLSVVILREIDSSLPERTATLFPEVPGHDLGLERVDLRSGSLYLHDFLVGHPELIDEFVSKQALAKKIITTHRADEKLPDAAEPFALHRAPEQLHDAVYDLSLVGHAFRRLR